MVFKTLKRILVLTLAMAVVIASVNYVPKTVKAADAFENSIKNFPASYKPYLRTLHKKYPNWINIDKIRKRLIDFDRLSEDKIFENYIEIETRIFDLYNDSYDAMCYLDGYIQYLYDQYRGK